MLGPDRASRVLTWLAAAGIASSVLIMIVASLLRSSWMFPHLTMPAAGPPWALQPVRGAATAVIAALWLAAVLGAGGVVAGLAAVRRGARPSARMLLVGAISAVAVLTVLTMLPPVGSTDALDYATYGRILTLGHSPYVMTPYHLRMAQGAFARSVPRKWEHSVSVYGPLATAEQFLAARLGGASIARVVFWLKLWNTIAFGVVAIAIDRMLRADPARRLRAHLLWTANPLLLWDLIAAGHLDVLAAAAGLLGLLVAGRQAPGQQAPGQQAPGLLVAGRQAPGRPWLGRPSAVVSPGVRRALAAGALIGTAADIKINYVLFGLALAWTLRRSPAALAAAAASALAVLLPSYAWFGLPAVRAILARRNTTSADNFYRLFIYSDPHWQAHIALIAAILVAATAVLLLWRLPHGVPARPAIRPALALSVAWLFFWPYQLPWYDTMIICLLVLWPASRLDWLVLTRLTAATISNLPGNPWPPRNHLLAVIDHSNVKTLAPLVLLGAAVGLITLCLSGQWKLRQPGDPPARRPGDPPDATPEPAEPIRLATG